MTQALSILLDRLSAADMVISYGMASHLLCLRTVRMQWLKAETVIPGTPQDCHCMVAGDLLRGGSNGVFYHAVEAPVESVVRCTSVLMLAGSQDHGAAPERYR